MEGRDTRKAAALCRLQPEIVSVERMPGQAVKLDLEADAAVASDDKVVSRLEVPNTSNSNLRGPTDLAVPPEFLVAANAAVGIHARKIDAIVILVEAENYVAGSAGTAMVCEKLQCVLCGVAEKPILAAATIENWFGDVVAEVSLSSPKPP